MDEAPVVFTGHRIEVALAQKAHVVALHQLVDVVGVAAHLGVEELNGPRILLSAMDGFFFFISLDGGCDLWSRDGQGQQNQQNHDEDSEQQKALLVAGTRSRRDGSGHHWRNGRVCVL